MTAKNANVALLSDADKAAAYDDLMAQQANGASGQKAPPRWKVVVSLKTAGDRVLYSSVSEKRAKKWVEDHCPRGSHFMLVSPDGETSSYEHERLTGGPRGEDVEAWQPFDRDAYQAPELNPVNVNDPWADAWEGAQ
jgi:hypothetical protein